MNETKMEPENKDKDYDGLQAIIIIKHD